MQAVFFTEGGKNQGLGHLTRCLALAQAFADQGITSKFVVWADTSVADLLAEHQTQYFNWTEGSADSRILSDQLGGADIAVIDSYFAGIDIYRQIQQQTKAGVYFDDYNRLPYPAGFVINGSLQAGKITYPAIDQIIYLLGPDFQPLRRPFWQIRTKPQHSAVESIFLTCGGSDPHQLTPVLAEFLTNQYPGIKIITLIGHSFQNPEKLKKMNNDKIQVLLTPPPEQLITAMQSSDIAVSTAGQTIYELAATGVPAIVIGAAENQKYNIVGWLTTNFIEFAGWRNDKNLLNSLKKSIDKLITDPALRQEKSRIGQMLIDGQGSRRIMEKVSDYVRKNQVHNS
jgi:UDP-2,4-diacetamido-2,4,6-trideoxy-beta-L-altropyranose hydrolase